MKILYTFTFDTETQEAATAGNVSTPNAVQILQQIAIAEAIEFGRKKNGKEVEGLNDKNVVPSDLHGSSDSLNHRD